MTLVDRRRQPAAWRSATTASTTTGTASSIAQDSACVSVAGVHGQRVRARRQRGRAGRRRAGQEVTSTPHGAAIATTRPAPASTPAHDRTIGFTLPEAGGVEVRLQADRRPRRSRFFVMPAAGLACDATQLIACFYPGVRRSADFALADLPAGRLHLCIVKATIPGGAPVRCICRLSAFGNRKIEICTNDDRRRRQRPRSTATIPPASASGRCTALGLRCPTSTSATSRRARTQSVTLDTTAAATTCTRPTCGRGDGKERVVRLHADRADGARRLVHRDRAPTCSSCRSR